MKKTIIITSIALGFTLTTLNAKTLSDTSTTSFVAKGTSEVSPFCMSIVKGDLETVKKLIELGADVNSKSNGLTPAMYAAKFNRVAILKFLVEQGAKLDKKSDKGFTALKYAELSNAKDAEAYIKSLS
ncbi:MAG: ankyrin repeat domain-containing protein [Gelidibacter sp.]